MVKDSTIEDLVKNGHEQIAIYVCKRDGMTTSDVEAYIMAIQIKLSANTKYRTRRKRITRGLSVFNQIAT